jgi:glycosyltransferase involved in cell wall biosynthesis/predicted Zn-dependent protease
LFDAFPSLRRVYFLPPNPSPQIHLLLRMMMRHVPTFRGMGVTPECDYGKEWFEGIDIFKKYGVTRRPAWIRAFLPGPAKAGTESGPHCSNQPALPPSPLSPEAAASTPAAGRVVLAPKGSLIGMVGSKRNCIDPQLWPQLLEFVRERGFLPVVIGTPDERALYPALEGCEDRRSYSFKEQMELIAGSQVFIGADSWGKTFAALAGLPTIVFDPLKGADWRGKKDPSDFVFIDPWDTIAKVHSLEECRDAFTRFTQGVPPEVVGRQWRKRRTARPTPLGGVRLAWEGSFLDYGSLSHVNRALTDALEAQPGLKLVRRQTTPPAAALPAPLRAYAHRLTRSGVSVSPARSNSAKGPTRGKHPSTESDAWPTVTVRHAWPPDWSPVSQGPLVVIQPWEYGALPEDWVHQAGHVTQFWVPSEYVRRVYVASGVPAEKVKVVPNGFDPQRFHPGVAPMPLATRKRFKFLFVGGTIPRKGADLLLQTYLDEFTAQDDVCLVVKDFGGQSVYAGQTLEAQIRAAQSRPGAPEILYLNEELPPEALPSLYTACDCLVHPYRGEGFGLPVLEAMACGLPVIVTAGGATDDFATPDVVYPVPAQPRALGRVLSGMKLAATGWWLEPIAITLAAQMRHVVEHPTEARAKGRAAAERARRQWTWEHAAQQARRHLEDLLAAEGLNLRDPAAPELAGERRSTEAPKAAASHPPARNGTPTGHPASAGTPPPRQAAPLQLPPCALLGHLGEARELLRRKKLREAWEATRAAIAVRPFHPEAYLLLAEIAAAAGDSVSARRCAQHARDLAPGFRPAKQFLQSHPRGRTRPEWLHLPEALGAVDTPAPKPSTAGNHAGHASRHAPHAPRLTVCLITKNEEQFLGQCLQSVRELADQIVVMDTGSTDWTTTIAARFGAEVYSCEWQDDFSAARNAALEHARGDWILFLDADEELLPESRNALLKEIRDPSAIAYRLPIVDKGREDEGRSFVPRLFRNAPGLFYVGRVHEQIFSSLEVRRRQWGLENKLGTATLRHHGYTTEIVRDRQKIERNLRLLQRAIEELPGEPNLLMNLGLELARSGQAEAALARYWEAFDAMAALPRDQVVPELREALLTQLSTRLIAAKRFEDVVQLLRSPLARAGGLTASLHFALGLALLELKQFAPAAEQMRECLAKRRRPALTPINKEILGAGPQHCLALCLSALQRPAEAEQAFRAALQDDPRSRAARWDFANFLREQDRPLDALKVLNELIALQPDDPAAWRAGGQIALSRSEFLEFARDWTGEAVKFCPQDPVVLNQRAEALTLSEAVTEALPLWRQLRAQQRLAQRAPLVICELLANELGEPFEADDERAVSREFIQWYQRLVQAGAHSVVLSLNGRVEALRRRLPSAARLLDAALSEAKTSELN